MRRVTACGVLGSIALLAVTFSGCVTEEIGPTELHTTAYVEHDAASNQSASEPSSAPSPLPNQGP